MRGLYQAVRNPRSHGNCQDTEDDAVTIILFINHLLKTIDQAKTPFSHNLFVKRVLDPDFVPKKRYAELLVSELPTTKRIDIFYDVFYKLNEGESEKLKFFFEALLDKMTEEEQTDIKQEISNVLRDADDTSIIRKIIQSFPSDMWPSISEVSRLRVENMLVQSVKDGKYHASQDKCRGGSFGTWSTNLIKHFTLKTDLYRVLCNKLSSSDVTEQDYVFAYFSGAFTDLYNKPPKGLIDIVNNGLNAGDVRYKMLVENNFFWSEDEWTSPFKVSIEKFEEAGKVFNPDDEIPF
ncbi:MAG: hypothetical protein A2005_03225 [Desulfuromonadales bacterium GWC2_61_20]|nr:MAG: hypothetical protein A2005_03225 [Desulfuromonadales bacterium GWC2_61_20]